MHKSLFNFVFATRSGAPECYSLDKFAFDTALTCVYFPTPLITDRGGLIICDPSSVGVPHATSIAVLLEVRTCAAAELLYRLESFALWRFYLDTERCGASTCRHFESDIRSAIGRCKSPAHRTTGSVGLELALWR